MLYHDVHCLEPFSSIANEVADPVPFFQAFNFIWVCQDVGHVQEKIFDALIGNDKTIALVDLEPLDNPRRGCLDGTRCFWIHFQVGILRVRAIDSWWGIEILGFQLIALINAVMIYYSLPWIRTVGGFESPVLRLPNRLIHIIIPIGSGLVILYCLYHILLSIVGGAAGGVDSALDREAEE